MALKDKWHIQRYLPWGGGKAKMPPDQFALRLYKRGMAKKGWNRLSPEQQLYRGKRFNERIIKRLEAGKDVPTKYTDMMMRDAKGISRTSEGLRQKALKMTYQKGRRQSTPYLTAQEKMIRKATKGAGMGLALATAARKASKSDDFEQFLMDHAVFKKYMGGE